MRKETTGTYYAGAGGVTATLYKLHETLVVFCFRSFKMLKISNVSTSWYQKTEKNAKAICSRQMGVDLQWFGKNNVRKINFEGMNGDYPYNRLCVWSFITFWTLWKVFEAIGRVRKYLRTTLDSPRMRKCKNLPREAPFIDT